MSAHDSICLPSTLPLKRPDPRRRGKRRSAAVAVRRRRRTDRVFRAVRPGDASADLGQGGCEGLDRIGVVRRPETDDAHVDAGISPSFDRRLQLARVLAGTKPHVDRPLDLGRIAPKFCTVSLEDVAFVAPLAEIGKGRVPMLRKPSDDPERAAFTVATDRDRRMWTLDRLRLTPGVGQREVLSGEVRPRRDSNTMMTCTPSSN